MSCYGMKCRKWTDEDYAYITDKFYEGKTYKEIAKKFGVSGYTIRNKLIKLGLINGKNN